MSKRTFCQNKLPKIIFLLFWLSINIVLFLYNVFLVRGADRFNYISLITNGYITYARAFGFLINFNAVFVLLPINRAIISWLREKVFKYLKGAPRRLFDLTKSFHLLCVALLIFTSVMHTIFHGLNLVYLHLNFSEAVPDLNIQPTKEKTTLWGFLELIPGWTGIVLLAALAVIIVTSLKCVRRTRFETFFYSHQICAFIFVVVMLFHGFGEITKFQINVDQHPVECHDLDKKIEIEGVCNERPVFDFVKPASWKWLLLPIILIVIDRIIRIYRSFYKATIKQIRLHNGNIIELVLYKKGFKAVPGQFVLVQSPEIAEFEWHAFTLSRKPWGKVFKVNNKDTRTTSMISFWCLYIYFEQVPYNRDGVFSVHIKVTGDWTEKLFEIIPKDDDIVKRLGNTCIVNFSEEKDFPTIRVTGPYGSPNQDAFKYPVNISIGAGIGITPYAALLNTIKDTAEENPEKLGKLKKVYLYLVCQKLDDFAWVMTLVQETEKALEAAGKTGLLETNLFLTRVKKPEEVTDDDASVTWVANITRYGRPKFEEEFLKVALKYEKERIGVFFCGPQPLGHLIYKKCSTINQRKNVFIFNKESFG